MSIEFIQMKLRLIEANSVICQLEHQLATIELQKLSKEIQQNGASMDAGQGDQGRAESGAPGVA